MLKRFLPTLGVLSACILSATSAQAATIVITPSLQPAGTDFLVAGNVSSGPIAATFGHTGITAGDFTDLFEFTIPQNGIGSGSVTTSVNLAGVGGLTDLDITSVLVNGIAATGFFSTASNTPCTTPNVGGCGANEMFAIDAAPIVGGALNTITVNGFSRGLGSFGGNATFSPSVAAVPEPGTWALMLLGFGAAGFALRTRKREQQTLAFA